ncbi:MAG: T9SS type A sorting domain-containing protein [Bacteroidetes bacterium]|nr:T9SS type A sorting domain-containing protein [Bacteroidota bacterium]
MKVILLIIFSLIIQCNIFAQNPGNSLDFDGSNDYISVPNATALDIANQITIELTTVVSNVAPGWSNSRQNIVFYNGSNFFLLYSVGDGNIWYKSSSDNLTWSGPTSLVSDQDLTETAFNIYLVDDGKFDLAYFTAAEIVARTCTISGATITVGDLSVASEQGASVLEIAVVRAGPAPGRVYVFLRQGGGVLTASSANQTGDVLASFTWDVNTGNEKLDRITMVPYLDADQVLLVFFRDPGGSNSDGAFYRVWPHGAFPAYTEFHHKSLLTGLSNPVRLSDTDFRVIVRRSGEGMREFKFDGGTGWTTLDTNIDPDGETDQESPSLFYDRISDDMYLFSIDNSTGDVERHKQPSGDVWGTEVVVDGGESTTRSLPITQMHEPPYGSSRTDPRQLVWAYRVQNGANFDLKVGSIGTSPLPVELVSFTGKVKDQKVYLNWSTATEVNNYGFEVERKNPPLNPLQGGDFERVGFVEGHGNSNSQKEYNFIDSEINPAGIYSYRLKQIDNDGAYEFSNQIEVNFNVPIKFELSQNYPNPFNPSTTMSFNLPKSGVVTLKVYNLMGEEIKTLVEGYKEAGIYTVNFNAKELASGMYLYRLSTNGFTETKKLLLMK